MIRNVFFYVFHFFYFSLCIFPDLICLIKPIMLKNDGNIYVPCIDHKLRTLQFGCWISNIQSFSLRKKYIPERWWGWITFTENLQLILKATFGDFNLKQICIKFNLLFIHHSGLFIHQTIIKMRWLSFEQGLHRSLSCIEEIILVALLF